MGPLIIATAILGGGVIVTKKKMIRKAQFVTLLFWFETRNFKADQVLGDRNLGKRY